MTDTREPPERILDETVWAVCPYTEGRDLEECLRCPEWREDPDHGRLKAGCRSLAEEACRIARADLPRDEGVREAARVLARAIRRGEDGAGTLTVKESVKVRIKDWHAICDLAEALRAALAVTTKPEEAPDDRA